MPYVTEDNLTDVALERWKDIPDITDADNFSRPFEETPLSGCGITDDDGQTSDSSGGCQRSA